MKKLLKSFIMFDMYVAENKGCNPVLFRNNRVRVYVDGNLSYGLWIDEDFLFSLLNEEQKNKYLKDARDYKITKEIAQKIIEKGHTPFVKQKL